MSSNLKTKKQNLLKIAPPDEALYREMMLSLGYPKNKVNFLELALILSYSEVKRLEKRKTIEKALLYRAGFTDDRDGLPEDFDFSLKIFVRSNGAGKKFWKKRISKENSLPEFFHGAHY